MKKLLAIFGAALLLAACANTPRDEKADAEAHAACRDVDPPVGSHRVRRSDCAPAAQAQRQQDSEQARREAELLQQSQILRSTGPKRGG